MAPLVLMDTGRPPPITVSQDAHAGCLSFELSVRQQRIVVNCGLPTIGRDTWRQVARATAAHATVTFNDTSSCRFIESGAVKHMMHGTPMVGGPRDVQVAREQTSGGTVLRTSHDGYAELFNVTHHRAVMLAADGQKLDGEDTFVPAKGDTLPAGRDQFAVRFHLHPSVRASRLADGRSAMLVMPNKDVWTFNAYEDQRRNRGERLSRRQRRAAPDAADRDLRQCPQGDARAVDHRADHDGRRPALAAAATRNRNSPWNRHDRTSPSSPALCCPYPTRAV